MNSNELQQTPSQTVGPYFAYGLTAEQYLYDYTQIADGNLVKDATIKGERITIKGQVLDGDGNFIPDAMIEIWQADSEGQYPNLPAGRQGISVSQSSFSGFGRQGTGTHKDGCFIFETIKPGSAEGAAPHINVIVFMRGLLIHAYTRLYFSDEVEANPKDEILNTVPSERRQTLIANKTDEPGKTVYLFNVYMRGDNETVFFDV